MVTVKALRGELAEFKGDEHVVILRETDEKVEFFEIESVSSSRGQPRRLENDSAAFSFSVDGPVSWVFINVEDA